VIERIDDPESYIGYLTILGQKHVMYEAEPKYIDQMGYMFLSSIKPILEKEVSEFSPFRFALSIKYSFPRRKTTRGKMGKSLLLTRKLSCRERAPF